MNELIAYAQSIISFLADKGAKLAVESQRALGELLQNVLEVIQGEESPADTLPPNGPPPEAPQLDQGPFPSSNVNSFKYDPKTKQLYVKFHGTDSAESGPTYLYQGIPQNIYDIFSRGRVAPKTSGSNRYHTWIRGVTPSLGASLYALIREGSYPYQRIS